MKRFILMVLCFLFFIQLKSQEVMQLEHSLRWVSEYNFPNLLENKSFEHELIQKIKSRLSQKLATDQIKMPDHINYRLINAFGKSKIKFPKTSTKETQIAITSAITRSTVGFRILWSMHVIVKSGKKIILDNTMQHELEPFSVSIRLSNKAWLDESSFANVFIQLLEECLGQREYANKVITLGSLDMVKKQVEQQIQIDKEYTLAVCGAMMKESNALYRLLKDSAIINEFYYKEGWDKGTGGLLTSEYIVKSLFSSLTGIELYYSYESTQVRQGTITTISGNKQRVKLEWLAELTEEISSDEIVEGKIISPITGQLHQKESLTAQFVLYLEHEPIEIKWRDAHFKMGTEDWMESKYSIVGEYNNQPFELVYKEIDAYVSIFLGGYRSSCSFFN
ncbi:hypothetical protein [Carboxylicivirga marina]|uniref:Uncharacterized protein n=1 Tax=Carboxylicivirga marina TaxID=2800988 RepID=A0ABS1HEB9_9BACT|nr:hypothetical protein [Carboxylicivirga marina]MBK3515966.1 hypothetical protein [Carboxylicivirga marina]